MPMPQRAAQGGVSSCWLQLRPPSWLSLEGASVDHGVVANRVGLHALVEHVLEPPLGTLCLTLLGAGVDHGAAPSSRRNAIAEIANVLSCF